MSLPTPIDEIQIQSYRYDLRVIGAPRDLTQAHSEAGWGQHLPPSRVLARIRSWRAVLEPRAAGLHQIVVRENDDRVICSCGLVVDATTTFDAAEGHLDLDTWNKAGVYVVLNGAGRPVAACQCGWREEREEYADARATADEHGAEHGW